MPRKNTHNEHGVRRDRSGPKGEALEYPGEHTATRIEEAGDDRAFEAVMAATDPFAQYGSIAEAAKQTGIHPSTIKRVMQRLVERSPFGRELRRVRGEDLLTLIDDRLMMLLEYMDEFDIAGATLRDKAVAFGILAEKKQLLSGLPTSIISVEERMSLEQLLPALAKEMQRRNITMDMLPAGDGSYRAAVLHEADGKVTGDGETMAEAPRRQRLR